MKRVFLIGDSIRIGYDAYVRELLEGRAQVYWSGDNARFVQYTLRYISEWAVQDCDPERIDIAYWNNGLWDAAHVFGDEQPQTPLDEYKLNLRRIIGRLRRVFPAATIIFGTTTSVIEERMTSQFYRRNAEIERYNDAARTVMREENVAVSELYDVSRAMPDDWHSQDGTHFTEDGYRALAEAVARDIGSFLREG